jgi:U4/U6.U5 tri-snRNP-associated protein 2
LQFYCLPDNYEVIDASLKDITVCAGVLLYTSAPHRANRNPPCRAVPPPQDNLDPTFAPEDIARLDHHKRMLRALDGSTYYQGTAIVQPFTIPCPISFIPRRVLCCAVLCSRGSHTIPSVSPAGIIGLNNIKRNDYMNVVIQALSHVGDLRDFFLRAQNYSANTDPLGMRDALASGCLMSTRDPRG